MPKGIVYCVYRDSDLLQIWHGLKAQKTRKSIQVGLKLQH